MFSYCVNSPAVFGDSAGNCPHTLYSPWMNDCDQCIIYDVPLYDQGKYSLCWAYCQTMIEDYKSKRKQNNSSAELSAISLALLRKNKDGYWDKGSFPTNCKLNSSGMPTPMFVSSYFTIGDLYTLLQNTGPIYAYYENANSAHLVVVVGVNLKDGVVYTNNPWGKKGAQSYERFTVSVVGKSGEYPYSLTHFYIPEI